MRKVRFIVFLSIILFNNDNAHAQFIDHFKDKNIKKDKEAIHGWAYYTGDGTAEMDFVQGEDFGKIVVDATDDKQNIWWALIKRNVSPALNLKKLKHEDFELRIEARIRSSHSLKRVNMHLNTQNTTDFHSQLMEFNIPDSINWHTISMTTKNFEVSPGDTVFAQLALMDWGLERYEVDIDYLKVDVVNIKKMGADKGDFSPYHPPVPDLQTFTYHLPANQESIIDQQYQELNFYNWKSMAGGNAVRLITVSGTQYPVLKWNLEDYKGKKSQGAGLLELTTFELQNNIDYKKDFGMVRIVEILAGNEDWDEKTVTYENLLRGEDKTKVFNTQMIIDVDIAPETGAENFMVIPHYVMQRIIDRQTKGIVILPLGAVHASFYTKESGEEKAPKLHFNIED